MGRKRQKIRQATTNDMMRKKIQLLCTCVMYKSILSAYTCSSSLVYTAHPQYLQDLTPLRSKKQV